MTADELKRLFPNASKSCLRANGVGVRPDDPKPTQRNPLVSPVPGKDKGGSGPPKRTRIRFTIYSVRPGDWDSYSIKELQDWLIKAEIIAGDDWGILQGEVISEKAHSKEEERTLIEIWLTP